MLKNKGWGGTFITINQLGANSFLYSSITLGEGENTIHVWSFLFKSSGMLELLGR